MFITIQKQGNVPMLHFRKVLPAFLVPRKLVNLESVPHLPNGKVDMQTLKTYFK